MTGNWFVKHERGDMEEFWGEPMGNNMISYYRCVKNQKILFYEFVTIERTDSVPVMMLRHFNPGSIAWEDKTYPNDHPLIKLERNKATFKNSDGSITLIYKLTAADKMDVILKEKGKEGRLETTSFHYERKRIH